MDHETISVIICTFNRAGLLRRAIDSVLRQTHKSLEIIVVDDGSVDDTPAVVERIADDRIRYLRHPDNRGLAAARNTGIRSAKGQFVAFLDDDDTWREDKLEVQLRALGEEYDAIVTASEQSWRGQGMPLRRVTLSELRRGNPFDPSSLLARAKVFEALHFDETLPAGVGEDWDIFIRIVQRFRLGYLDMPLVEYNDGDHARITNARVDMDRDELERRMAVIEKHRELFGSGLTRFHRARMLLSYLAHRRHKLAQILYAVRTCGPDAVLRVLVNKVVERLIPAL